jgi:uncharacterized membrane protein
MNDIAPWSDQDIMTRIAWLLRAGVLASALLVLAGGVIFLCRHQGEQVPDRRSFEPEPPEFSQPILIVQEAMRGRGRAMIQLGLLLLLATPVLRVIFSIFAFARQRDLVFVLLPLVVLVVLLVGFFLVPRGR